MVASTTVKALGLGLWALGVSAPATKVVAEANATHNATAFFIFPTPAWRWPRGALRRGRRRGGWFARAPRPRQEMCRRSRQPRRAPELRGRSREAPSAARPP